MIIVETLSFHLIFYYYINVLYKSRKLLLDAELFIYKGYYITKKQIMQHKFLVTLGEVTGEMGTG